MKKSISILLLSLAMMPSVTRAGQQQTLQQSGNDSVTIRFTFRQGAKDLDLSYMENVGQYVHLQNVIDGLKGMRAKSLTFTGSASPEGNYERNRVLTHERMESVTSMLRNTYPAVFGKSMATHSDVSGNSWGGIVERLKLSKIEGREEAIRLIDKYGKNVKTEYQSAILKDSLSRIEDGKTWDAIYSDIFPYLRSGVITVVFEPARSERDTLVVIQPPADRDSLFKLQQPGTAQYIMPVNQGDTVRIYKVKKPYTPFMAVKTNMLFDLATALNFEVEVPIGKRWSVMLEHTFPWWLPKFGGQQYALEWLRTGVEGRYWFGNSLRNLFHPSAPACLDHDMLQGFFIGLYANADKFDFEWKDNGVQGTTFCDFGLSFGWNMAIHQNWRIEFSGAVGYFHANAKKYHQGTTRNQLIYEEDYAINWFAPTKLKCSIVWLIPNQGWPFTSKSWSFLRSKKNQSKKGGMK